MSQTPPKSPGDDSGDRPSGRPRQLLRSSEDKMLGGVAGGLAGYFNVDPVLIRIGFAITGLMGIGLLVYLALFIFVPEDDGWGNPVQARERDRLIAGGAILVLLLAIPGGIFPLVSLDWWWGLSAALFWLAVLAGVGYAMYWLVYGNRRDNGTGPASHAAAQEGGPGGRSQPGGTADTGEARTKVMPQGDTAGGADAPGSTQARSGGRDTSLGRVLVMVVLFSALAIFSLFLAATSAWGAAVGGGGFIAVAVILSGALIALAAFRRPMRWLIVPALALALPAAAVQASGFELDGGYGERVIRPSRLADIPSDGYKMAAGNLTIDLRQADWRPGSEVELPASLSFGRIAVIVPEHVCVASDIDVWAGGFEILGESDSDFRLQYRRAMPEQATPKLTLDGKVDIGWVEVLTHMPFDDRGEHHRGLRDPDATQPAHCLNDDRATRDRGAQGRTAQDGAKRSRADHKPTADRRGSGDRAQRLSQRDGARRAAG